LDSSSPRLRWVEASSERIRAREEGDEESAVAAALPLGVPGLRVLVEPVGVDAVSSSVDVGCFNRVAVRSASLVSTDGQHVIRKCRPVVLTPSHPKL
jgi:hypothetical protein